jgi:hypothetical protein
MQFDFIKDRCEYRTNQYFVKVQFRQRSTVILCNTLWRPLYI